MSHTDISTNYTPITDFESWLECITTEYKNLSDEERNQTLQSLIEASCSTQLCYLHSKIQILVYRDFFRLLPTDITEFLLTFLDPKTLLKCCQVSLAWNNIISNDVKLWYNACKELEMKVDEDRKVYTALKWKNMFVEMSELLNKMKNSKVFKSCRYLGHSIRVTAVWYWNNKIATGSDDHTIRLWNCATDTCIAIIPTECTVSRIKFDDNILILGSYGGFLKAFSLKTHNLLQDYQQHTAAVFCLDYIYDLNLLASGGADDTIRTWSIENGTSLSTLTGHSHWVISVLLIDKRVENNLNNSILLLSMDREEIRIWSTSNLSINFICDQRIQISILNNNFVTPGVHCDGERIYFVKQDPSSVTKFCCWSLDLRKIEFEKELNFKVKILLGVGKKYFCVVTPTQDNEKPNLLICSIKSLKVIVRWYIPPSRATSPGNSQMTFGESEWLNGLDGSKPNGLIFASGLDDCSYYILKWDYDKSSSSRGSFVTAYSF